MGSQDRHGARASLPSPQGHFTAAECALVRRQKRPPASTVVFFAAIEGPIPPVSAAPESVSQKARSGSSTYISTPFRSERLCSRSYGRTRRLPTSVRCRACPFRLSCNQRWVAWSESGHRWIAAPGRLELCSTGTPSTIGRTVVYGCRPTGFPHRRRLQALANLRAALSAPNTGRLVEGCLRASQGRGECLHLFFKPVVMPPCQPPQRLKAIVGEGVPALTDQRLPRVPEDDLQAVG